MGARLFVLAFVLLIACGFWFHKSYMASFGNDLSLSQLNQNAVQELITIRPFQSLQFSAGQLRSEINAKEVRYFNNGRVVLTGNIEYKDHDDKGRLTLVIKTEKALGEIVSDGRSADFLHSEKKLKTINLPDQVKLIFSEQDEVLTKNVEIDFVAGILKTTENVELKGPGRQVTAKGLVYQMGSQEYRLSGPIKATFIPSLTTPLKNQGGSKF